MGFYRHNQEFLKVKFIQKWQSCRYLIFIFKNIFKYIFYRQLHFYIYH